jgi:hypothetical protein
VYYLQVFLQASEGIEIGSIYARLHCLNILSMNVHATIPSRMSSLCEDC